MSNHAEEVLQQTRLFREKVVEVPVEQAGKWVVFESGEIRSFHDNASDAYASAVESFGFDVPYVVAQVVASEPTPISAGVCFGLE